MDLTEYELALYCSVTRARINQIERKALKRLRMTAEEKELLRLRRMLKTDPVFRDVFITMLIACI